jgi:hypothetical protein
MQKRTGILAAKKRRKSLRVGFAISVRLIAGYWRLEDVNWALFSFHSEIFCAYASVRTSGRASVFFEWRCFGGISGKWRLNFRGSPMADEPNSVRITGNQKNE